MSGKRITELEGLVAEAERRAGPGDPVTLAARLRLALAYRRAERDKDAVAELRQVVALREACLGAEHPDTLAARHELALSYFHVSIGNGPAWLSDAVTTMELTADGRLAALGPAHPDTLASWAPLPYWYQLQHRSDDQGRLLLERIAAGWEQIVTAQERHPGPDEPETQFSRVKLAGAYQAIARTQDERVILERVIESWAKLAAARSRDLGPVHPDTVYARERHAYSHRQVGRVDDEVPLIEQIAADHERLLGPGDPRTLRALARLASRYDEANYDRPAAVALAERVIGDAYRALGPDDRDVRVLRAVLIVAYALAGRSDEAFALRDRFPTSADEADEE